MSWQTAAADEETRTMEQLTSDQAMWRAIVQWEVSLA